MSVRLRQLEAFRAVSQSGSMTKAAKQLGISQPAVSRLIGSFGDNVGFRLFERANGQLVPTQESRFLLREVSRLIDSLNHIDELTHNITHRIAGHLRIACLPGFATSHMPGVLSRFLENRPGVTVTLEPDRPERILEWIIGEQYDCGITDDFSDHPAVDSEQIPMRTVCVMADGNPLARYDVIEPEHLKDEPIIHTKRDSMFFKDLNEAFTARNVTINSWIETRQFTAACMLIAEGTGVSIISELDAKTHQDRGLIIRPFRPVVPHRLSLVRPTHGPTSMLTLEFLEFFADSLQPFRHDPG
ncbi:MAG: LysR substrate-binding domain-containing protein [Alphaproteobacteria bacterium]|nr:LysR substrate-binding domain-containing protein [Alphaproteobacteria bacterium]